MLPCRGGGGGPGESWDWLVHLVWKSGSPPKKTGFLPNQMTNEQLICWLQSRVHNAPPHDGPHNGRVLLPLRVLLPPYHWPQALTDRYPGLRTPTAVLFVEPCSYVKHSDALLRGKWQTNGALIGTSPVKNTSKGATVGNSPSSPPRRNNRPSLTLCKRFAIFSARKEDVWITTCRMSACRLRPSAAQF